MFKKLRSKLRNTWNEASLVDRNDFKVSLKSCLGVIGVASCAATGVLLTATTAPILPVLAGVAVFAGTYGGIAVAATTETLVEDIKQGKEQVEWDTILGQKIKSTVAQQKDLQLAQKTFWKASPSERKSIVARFKAVADKVTVVKDIENGTGKFRYAQPKVR